jgi:hypothetical protein
METVHPCPGCGSAMYDDGGVSCSGETRVFVDDYFLMGEPIVDDYD